MLKIKKRTLNLLFVISVLCQLKSLSRQTVRLMEVMIKNRDYVDEIILIKLICVYGNFAINQFIIST